MEGRNLNASEVVCTRTRKLRFKKHEGRGEVMEDKLSQNFL
jgi:hypothetical protein